MKDYQFYMIIGLLFGISSKVTDIAIFIILFSIISVGYLVAALFELVVGSSESKSKGSKK